MARITGIRCTAAAQNSAQQKANELFSIRATHLVGFENAKSNSSGTLSIPDDYSEARIKVGSVRDIVLGEESRQRL